jgi:hypothetical protein
MQREAGQQPVLAGAAAGPADTCCRPRWTPTAASTKPSEGTSAPPLTRGFVLVVGTAGFEPATPCSQSQIGRGRHLRRCEATQVVAASALSVVVHSCPVGTVVNGTLVAQPARMTR